MGKCAEESTSEALQQIIQETTNRMNRLSQQESKNEVTHFEIKGEIDQQKLNADLLDIQYEHSKQASQSQGLAEADRIVSFMEGISQKVPDLDNRISIWQTLRKTEALAEV